MGMAEADWQAWRETALLCADAAAAVTRRWFRADPPVSFKDASSPIVTLADQESEAAMRAVIQARHPTHGIHGEEGGEDAGAPGAPVWVLDPIDGTIAFTCGKAQFCTLIGVTVGGVSVVGVIDQPIQGERWVGDPTGTTLNGARVSVCARELSSGRLASTAPEAFGISGVPRGFVQLARAMHVTTWGGDAYNYALLSSGFLDLVVESGLAWHDWAALVPVVRGAGGVITDWRGDALRPGYAQVVAAASPALHAAALERLAGDAWPGQGD